MKLEEAILLLDSDFDEFGIGRNHIRSKVRDLWLMNSRHGLVKCTHDWPVSYNPNIEDSNADDWVLVNNIKEVL